MDERQREFYRKEGLAIDEALFDKLSATECGDCPFFEGRGGSGCGDIAGTCTMDGFYVTDDRAGEPMCAWLVESIALGERDEYIEKVF